MGKPRERQFIVDYVTARFPGKRVIFNCPLGPVPETLIATWGRAKALRVSRGLRPEVDALVFDGQTLIFIESKIREWLNGISKLPVYARMADDTPELQAYKSWTRRMILAIPFTSETIQSAARTNGVEIDVFSTPDVESYLIESGKYWTPEWKKAQAERKRTIALLGLD
jgi:hypothetical protein